MWISLAERASVKKRLTRCGSRLYCGSKTLMATRREIFGCSAT